MGEMPVNFSGVSHKLQLVLKPQFLESHDSARLPACNERKRVCLVFEIAEEELNMERCKKSSFRMLINSLYFAWWEVLSKTK